MDRMKILSDILYKTSIESVIGSTSHAIESITSDSRAVKPLSLFVAVSGETVDGHNYIKNAVESGAIAIVCEHMPEQLDEKVTYILVRNSKESLGYIAANFYNNPSEKLTVVGITGTNGKTTTVTLLHDLFTKMGYECGLLSTVVNKIGTIEIKATHTTPDAISLQHLLSEMVDAGCEFVFMEVSSHAIIQHRVTGTHYKEMVFTNITHDHLDYHGTFKEYIIAKKLIFDRLSKNSIALINSDDSNGDVMVQNSAAKVQTYGLKTMADFRAKIIENDFSGLHLYINNTEIYAKLIGRFNAYNLLVAFAVATDLGIDEMETLVTLSSLTPVAGRFQHTKTETGITAIVDYAHTPDALKNVLQTIGEIRTGNEQVITVVGCGGDRDRAKRPVMAQIATEFSDKVILTSDNPRTEDPEMIIEEMQKGIEPLFHKKTMSITNRKEAIKVACTMANSGDIILIAGKGHEDYQDIKGTKHPFDDYKTVSETLKMLEK